MKQIPGIIRGIIEPLDKVTFDRSHFSALGPYSLDFETVYLVEGPDYNESVSYTHLDVYKRQSLENPAYHLYDYLRTCFHYIHNNPVAAGMTDKPGDWPFSSMNEYLYLDENLICNTIQSFNILGMKQVDVKNQLVEINDELVAIVQAVSYTHLDVYKRQLLPAISQMRDR